MSDPILNQILQNQNDTSEKIGGITEIVKRHDEVTFPEIQNSLLRMESKQNKDILQFIAAREEIHKRLEPLEADLLARQKRGEAFAKGSKAVLLRFTDKMLLVIIGIAIVAWKRIIEFFS